MDHSISMRFKVGFSSSNDGELVFLGLIKDSLSLAVNDQHNSLNCLYSAFSPSLSGRDVAPLTALPLRLFDLRAESHMLSFAW